LWWTNIFAITISVASYCPSGSWCLGPSKHLIERSATSIQRSEGICCETRGVVPRGPLRLGENRSGIARVVMEGGS